MNSVDKFVADFLRVEPKTCSTRNEVLLLALCSVADNVDDEMWWADGEVQREEREPWNTVNHVNNFAPLKEMFDSYEEQNGVSLDSKLQEYCQTSFEHHEENFARLRKIVENADTIAQHKEKITSIPFPETSHCLLKNQPKNISPDWKEVCEEIKTVAISQGWTF